VNVWKSIAVIMAIIIAWYAGYHQGKQVQYTVTVEGLGSPKPSNDDGPPLAMEFFDIQNPRIIKNFHDDGDPQLCTSLTFKAKIINLTDKKRFLSANFHIKDSDGITLDIDRAPYNLDPNSGTMKPRTIAAFSYGGQDFVCDDVSSVELRYSSAVDDKEVVIDLPIFNSD
jgi:hypothetical protein